MESMHGILLCEEVEHVFRTRVATVMVHVIVVAIDVLVSIYILHHREMEEATYVMQRSKQST